jgi:hypothetical protein
MNVKRMAAYVLLFAFCLAVPITSQAVICSKKTTTYWGYDYGDGPRCNAVVGPPPGPIVVGEKVIDCDGTVIQWGLTCTNLTPTVTYEDCPECETLALSTNAKAATDAKTAKANLSDDACPNN